jgi:hypothetical protein
MNLGYTGVGRIPKKPWKLLGKLKIGILVWAWGENLEYFIAIGLGNLWFALC